MKKNKETQSIRTGCELMCTGSTNSSFSRWADGPCCAAQDNNQGGNVVNSRFLTSEMQKSTHKTRQLESPATLKFNILSAMTDIIARW